MKKQKKDFKNLKMNENRLRSIVRRLLREQIEHDKWTSYLQPINKELQIVWTVLEKWEEVLEHARVTGKDLTSFEMKIRSKLWPLSTVITRSVSMSLPEKWKEAFWKHTLAAIPYALISLAPAKARRVATESWLAAASNFSSDDVWNSYDLMAKKIGISEEELLRGFKSSAEAGASIVNAAAVNFAKELTDVIAESQGGDTESMNLQKFKAQELHRYRSEVHRDVVGHLGRSDDYNYNNAVVSIIVRLLQGKRVPVKIPAETLRSLKSMQAIGLDASAINLDYEHADFRHQVYGALDSAWHRATRDLDFAGVKKFTDEGVKLAAEFPTIVRDIKLALEKKFDTGSEMASYGEAEQWAKSNRIKSAAEAPLGWIAFSPERMATEDIPYEPNTPVEKELRKNVLNYVQANTDIAPEKASLLKNLVSGDYYGDAIRYTPRSFGTLYRGLIFEGAHVERFPRDLRETLFSVPVNERARTVEHKFVYEPRNPSGLSSWSDSFDVAQEFAMANFHVGGEMFAIILQAEVADNPENFLDARHLFMKMGLRNELLNEREHFGLGKINISRMVVLRVDVEWDASAEELEEMGWYDILNSLELGAPTL